MSTRILFNGREYGDPAEMPDDVRRDYEYALAQFEDANKNGIPDVLENAGKNVIAVHQSSFSVNGKTFDGVGDLPPWARQLYEQAMGHALPTARTQRAPKSDAPARESPRASAVAPDPRTFASRFPETPDDLDVGESTDPLEATRYTLTMLVRVLLVVSAIAIVIGASMLFVEMDEGSKSQGGQFYVVVFAVLLLGVIVDRYVKLTRR